jgi:eukaryotic-like serine/threonine-protein kinase
VELEAPLSGRPRRWTFGGGRVLGYEPGMTVWSSPALGAVGGRALLFAGSYDRSLYAFDAATGEPLWKFTTGGGIYGAPVLWDDRGQARIFVASSDRLIYALDADDGRRIWNHQVEEYRPTLGGARLAAPCLGQAGGRDAVFVAHWVFDRSLAGSLQRGGVTALDARSGQVLWRRELGDNEMAAPLYAAVGGRRLLLVGSSNGNLYALDADRGETLWRRVELDAVRSPPALAEPAGKPLVILASKYGTLRALDPATGTEVWSYKTGDRITGSPAVAEVGGRILVLVGSYDRYLHAVDAATGALVWRHATRGGIYGSPAVAGSVILTSSWDHQLHAVSARDGSLLWSYYTGRPLWDAIALDESTWSSPAAARLNGRWMAYFGSYDGNLYALSMDELAVSAGPGRMNLGFWISLPLAVVAAGLLAVFFTRRGRRRLRPPTTRGTAPP